MLDELSEFSTGFLDVYRIRWCSPLLFEGVVLASLPEHLIGRLRESEVHIRLDLFQEPHELAGLSLREVFIGHGSRSSGSLSMYLVVPPGISVTSNRLPYSLSGKHRGQGCAPFWFASSRAITTSSVR